MSLAELSVRRPIAILMVTLAVSTFGYLAVGRLPVDLLPDLSYPTLTVQTVYEDAAPVSVEQFVTEPVEEAIGVIPGVRSMRSVSRPGLSEVILEFEWSREMDFAALDVREKLGLVRLPREAEPPRVLRFDPSLDPIVRLSFAGDRPLDDLRQLAERWLKPRLESVLGVAAAKIRGGLDPEIVVEADEGRLAALGLTVDDLATALQAENVNQPGGTLKDFNAVYLVRTLHEFQTLDQVRETMVPTSGGGRVRVEDVAHVYRGHRDRDEVTRSQGREVVGLDLHREGSANTVAVAAAVSEELRALRGELPRDLSLTVLADQSRYISDSITQVWSAALLGGLLAVMVLYFFLRDLPSTVIIALSIPVSVLATFLPMQQAGVSLNIMSLGGLALGVGMLVDNSIVVLEAIDRKRRQGLSRPAAAAGGAGEVAGAVTASTLTTVSVFFPIVFVQGIAGQLFHDQAVTVCFSLLASLVVALTLIPALAALDLGGAVPAPSTPGFPGGHTLFRWDQPLTVSARWSPASMGLLRFLRRGWGRPGGLVTILNWTLLLPLRGLALAPLLLTGISDVLFPYLGRVRLGRLSMGPVGNGAHAFSRFLSVFLYPLRLAVFALVVLLAGAWYLARRLLEVVFWPAGLALRGTTRVYPPLLTGALRLRWAVIGLAVLLLALALSAVPGLGTNLVPDLSQGQFAFQLHFPEGTTLEASEAAVASIEESLLADPAFAGIASLVGSLPSSASGRRTLGENLAQIDFSLRPDLDAAEESQAVGRVRRVLAAFPQADAELVRPSVLSVRPPIAIHVYAEDLNVLDAASRQVTAALESVEGVTDVASSAEVGNPEVRVELDRERAGTLGVSPALVGNALRRKIRGDKIGEFREGEERLDIRLRAAGRDRDTADDVAALRIPLADGTAVPVSAVATVTIDRGPAAIQRSGGARMAEVTARVGSGNLGGTLQQVEAALAAIRLPPGADAEMAGQNDDLETSYASLRLMLALAVFLVYVVMAAQFESLVHPFVILISVPLGIIGVVTALWLTGTAISVLVLIGAVMLAGIVVNNAIVLVDAVNRRRREGQALDVALVGAGGERLRPILMTTTTTVLALLPMSLGLGAGDELRAPLAITVIGGLLMATLLTLVVVPCFYRLFARGGAGEAVASPAVEKTPLPAGEEA